MDCVGLFTFFVTLNDRDSAPIERRGEARLRSRCRLLPKKESGRGRVDMKECLRICWAGKDIESTK